MQILLKNDLLASIVIIGMDPLQNSGSIISNYVECSTSFELLIAWTASSLLFKY